MFGDFLKRRRDELGKTQPDVAEVCGVHFNTVSRWEKTGNVPRKHLPALAEVLELELERLERAYRGEGYEAKEPEDSPVVRSRESQADWIAAVMQSDQDPRVIWVLATLGAFVERGPAWVVSMSAEDLLSETPIDEDLLREAWPAVMESPWLERVGSAEYVFQLRFPE